MTRRKADSVVVGGGADAMRGQGVTLPGAPEDLLIGRDHTNRPAIVRLGMGPDEERRGLEAVGLIREAVERVTHDDVSDRSVRCLARLVAAFPDIAPRLPEFWNLMTWLVTKGYDGAVTRISGEATRGRRRENYFFLIGLVDVVIEHHGGSVARAAQWIAEHYRSRFMVTARHIENVYAEHKRLYDAWQGGHFVPSDRLTRGNWRRH